jgi:hypothetical protein
MRFEMKSSDLDAAKAIHVSVQEMDGPLFEITKSLK